MERNLIEKGWNYKKREYEEVFSGCQIMNQLEDKEVKVSVIIIAWKWHPNLLHNLQSLMKQKEEISFEIIFVNNGAAKEEFVKVEQYFDYYVTLNENTGAYKARNIGALYANASILIFLEDDGVPEINYVKSHYLAHQAYDVLTVRGVCFPESGVLNSPYYSHYYRGLKVKSCFPELEGNMSVKASAFFLVGGWNDEILFGYGGFDLSLRVLKVATNKDKQIYSPVSLIYHDGMTDPEKQKAKKERQNCTQKILDKHFPEWREEFLKWIEYIGENHSPQIRDKEALIELFELQSNVMKTNLDLYFANDKFFDGNSTNVFLRVSHMQKMKNVKVYIFGAGSSGVSLLEILNNKSIEVAGFIDNNPSKKNKLLDGKTTCLPSDIQFEDAFILVASEWYKEISQQLQSQFKVNNFLIYKKTI